MGMGHFWLSGWDIYHLMDGALALNGQGIYHLSFKQLPHCG